MTLVRSQRWRRTLVAACLPYLFLSVFVDFIHLHPLLSRDVPQISVSQHVARPEARDSRLPDSPCAVCRWMQAGTGLQASVSAGPTVVALANDLTPLAAACPARSALLSPNFRGPPLTLFA